MSDTVESLPAKWRSELIDLPPAPHGSPAKSYNCALTACADELEAALASPAALSSAGPVGYIWHGAVEELRADEIVRASLWSRPTGQAGTPVFLHPQPATPASGDVAYEFEVWQGDTWQAGGSAQSLDDARGEANHYAMMYAQDGPVTVKLYERHEIPATPNPEQPAKGGE